MIASAIRVEPDELVLSDDALLDVVDCGLRCWIVQHADGVMTLSFELVAPVPSQTAIIAAIVMRDRFRAHEGFRVRVIAAAQRDGRLVTVATPPSLLQS